MMSIVSRGDYFICLLENIVIEPSQYVFSKEVRHVNYDFGTVGYYVSKDDFSTQPLYPPTDIIHTFKAFSFVPILLKMLPISDLLTSGETSLGELLGTCGAWAV